MADDTILAALRDFANLTDRWPGDDDVRNRLVTQALYGLVSQRRICMLLEACEYDIASTAGSEMLAVPDGLTIEHALPQQWREHWPIAKRVPDPEHAAAEREARVHRVGNLTLVSQKLNLALSNAQWSTKRAALSRRSQLLVNQLLCANETWGEEGIDRRSAELANRILATWPGPESRTWDA